MHCLVPAPVEDIGFKGLVFPLMRPGIVQQNDVCCPGYAVLLTFPVHKIVAPYELAFSRHLERLHVAVAYSADGRVALEANAFLLHDGLLNRSELAAVSLSGRKLHGNHPRLLVFAHRFGLSEVPLVWYFIHIHESIRIRPDLDGNNPTFEHHFEVQEVKDALLESLFCLVLYEPDITVQRTLDEIKVIVQTYNISHIVDSEVQCSSNRRIQKCADSLEDVPALQLNVGGHVLRLVRRVDER